MARWREIGAISYSTTDLLGDPGYHCSMSPPVSMANSPDVFLFKALRSRLVSRPKRRGRV